MGLHFLGKMKIMVVRDIERTEIDFICKVSLIFMIYNCKRKRGRKFGYSVKVEQK